jgi:2-polyprenyl-3-methyl-5-hydroxy-6-metoxy-1,4-benzoquinol methylase
MGHLMSRMNFIVDRCKDKDVLDVGSTGQTESYDLWPRIKKVAKSLTGIDVVDHHDLDIVTGNMENQQFNKKFDIIVVGDTIEHVHNQGLFLNNIREHLKEGGELIITTPNAKWFTIMLRPNPTHVLWHDYYTLAYILKETGFEVDYFAFYLGNKNYAWYKKPLVWRQSMLAVCKVNKKFKITKPLKVMV